MFEIGKNFHIIHMTDDLQELDRWYDDVFSVHRYRTPSYAEPLKRDASLSLIGGLCIETIAPAFRVDGWQDAPLGRFYRRFGRSWHSIVWHADGLADLYEALRSAGIRLYGVTGAIQSGEEPVGGIFTHPGDTYTQLQFVPQPSQPQRGVSPEEYARSTLPSDPRFLPGFNPAWWSDQHPLGILQTSHVTLTVDDTAAATHLFAEVLGGDLLHEGQVGSAGSRSAFVAVGEDLVLELATPSETSAGRQAGIAGLTFKVKDLDAAARFLASKGVVAATSDRTSLVTDPATTQGVAMGFTTWEIPNDTRGNWAVYPARRPSGRG